MNESTFKVVELNVTNIVTPVTFIKAYYWAHRDYYFKHFAAWLWCYVQFHYTPFSQQPADKNKVMVHMFLHLSAIRENNCYSRCEHGMF